MPQPLRRFTRFSLTIVCVLGALLTGWYTLRPYPRPSPYLVETRLSALQEPYTFVETSYFTDGGSIGISITDANGLTEQFALPNRMGRNENYSTVFVGAMHVSRPGAVPVAHSDATKQELIRRLGNYRKDADIQFTLAMLGGRWSDWAKALANRLRSKVSSQFSG